MTVSVCQRGALYVIVRGARYLMGENLKVVLVKISTLSQAVLISDCYASSSIDKIDLK
jgi:hypothetical protein